MFRTLLLLLCLICSACSATTAQNPTAPASETLHITSRADAREASSQLIREIELTSGIKFRLGGLTPPESWKVEYTHPTNKDEEELKGYLDLISIELTKYPENIIKRSKIKSISIVKNLSVNGQQRAAMPDYVNEVLYLDFLRGNYSKVYQAHVFHHEFFHLLEEEINGSVYFKDPNWNKLNPDGFNYGKGGANQRGSDNYPLVHPKPGFINRYSMAAIEEDKAEIFASLFVDSERKKIFAMAKNDHYLKTKIELMLDFLYEIDASLIDNLISSTQSSP